MGDEKTDMGQRDELSGFLTTYGKGPDRAYFKTTPPAGLIKTLTFFGKGERLLFLAVIVVTVLVRLVNLGYPDSVVFDEVHFGAFASRYIKGEYLVDVHPPLVKMIYAGIAKISGYDGSFDFSSIGNRYLDAEGTSLAPYVAMRAFPALCGVASALLVYRTAKLSGCRPVVCAFGALLCCFENSLATQSRYILLDAPMICFMGLVVFNYKAVQASQPLSKVWFRYLFLLGLFLGAAISSKWVGFFTMAWVGILTLRDFWLLAGDLDVSSSKMAKQFVAKFYFLFVTPLVFYLGLFALHFIVLPKVGDGSSHMTSRFQSSLENSVVHDYYSDIAFGSTVSIRHLATGGYLHSHNSTYPKTGNQQVTLYGFQDANNDWFIEKKQKANSSELLDTLSTVPNLQKLRLFHKSQKRYLRVNDVRPPMSEQDYNNEVTLIGDETYLGDGQNEVFEIKLINDRSVLHPGSEFKLKAVDSVFQIRHVGTNCFLLSHDVKLPSWGFDQNEVICIEKPVLENSLWYFEKNTHPLLESDENAQRVDLPVMGFWDKIKELHRVMVRINNGLTQTHTYASDPITWPFLERGVNYWGEDHRNVYFLGNIVVYWSIVVVVVGFVTYAAIQGLLVLRPTFFSSSTGAPPATAPATAVFKVNVFDYLLAWAIHYIPSFLMGRQMFLHHYLPSVFFGILVLTQTVEFITAKNRHVGHSLMAAMLTAAVLLFIKYSPLVYGLDWDFAACRDAKLFSTWDINCRNYIPMKP